MRDVFGYAVGFCALGIAAGVASGWLATLSYPLAAAMGIVMALQTNRPGGRQALETGLVGASVGVLLSVLVAAGVRVAILHIPVGVALWLTSLRFALPWFGLAVTTISGFLVGAVASAFR